MNVTPRRDYVCGVGQQPNAGTEKWCGGPLYRVLPSTFRGFTRPAFRRTEGRGAHCFTSHFGIRIPVTQPLNSTVHQCSTSCLRVVYRYRRLLGTNTPPRQKSHEGSTHTLKTTNSLSSVSSRVNGAARPPPFQPAASHRRRDRRGHTRCHSGPNRCRTPSYTRASGPLHSYHGCLAVKGAGCECHGCLAHLCRGASLQVLLGEDFFLAQRAAWNAVCVLSTNQPSVDARGMKLVGAWELAQLVASYKSAEAHRTFVVAIVAIGRCGLTAVTRQHCTLGGWSVRACWKPGDSKPNGAVTVCNYTSSLLLLPRITSALIATDKKETDHDQNPNGDRIPLIISFRILAVATASDQNELREATYFNEVPRVVVQAFVRS